MNKILSKFGIRPESLLLRASLVIVFVLAGYFVGEFVSAKKLGFKQYVTQVPLSSGGMSQNEIDKRIAFINKIFLDSELLNKIYLSLDGHLKNESKGYSRDEFFVAEQGSGGPTRIPLQVKRDAVGQFILELRMPFKFPELPGFVSDSIALIATKVQTGIEAGLGFPKLQKDMHDANLKFMRAQIALQTLRLKIGAPEVWKDNFNQHPYQMSSNPFDTTRVDAMVFGFNRQLARMSFERKLDDKQVEKYVNEMTEIVLPAYLEMGAGKGAFESLLSERSVSYVYQKDSFKNSPLEIEKDFWTAKLNTGEIQEIDSRHNYFMVLVMFLFFIVATMVGRISERR